MISNRQIRAARALLDWSQSDLAAAAGLSLMTIKRLEATEQPFRARFDTVMKVKAAVEAAGIEFQLRAEGQIEGGFIHRVQMREVRD
jgi:transcriptional regulator with XRE-family HTH domain